jgi:hypothetical protein
MPCKRKLNSLLEFTLIHQNYWIMNEQSSVWWKQDPNPPYNQIRFFKLFPLIKTYKQHAMCCSTPTNLTLKKFSSFVGQIRFLFIPRRYLFSHKVSKKKKKTKKTVLKGLGFLAITLTLTLVQP